MSGRPLRVALALSGGGSKGAFTVGALKVLRQKYRLDHFPIISGTSTGALIGTLLATNDWSTLVDVYSRVLTKHIVNRNYPNVARLFGTEAVLFSCALFGGRAIFDTRALEDTIARNVDWTAVREAYTKRDTLLVYSTVDLRSGRQVTFNNRDDDERVLERALLASSNQPVLMEPVEIEGRTGQYVDGGVREFLPLEAVFEHGASPSEPAGEHGRKYAHPPIALDAIVAISTSPADPHEAPEPLEKITQILARTVDLLNTEVGKDDYVGAQRVNALLRMVANATKPGRLTRDEIWEGIPEDVRTPIERMNAVHLVRISPAKHLPMNGLDFEPTAMSEAMALGVARALEVLREEDLFRGRA